MTKIKVKQIDGLDTYVNDLITTAIAGEHIEKIGYQGVLPNASPEGGIKSGMEFAVGTALSGTNLSAQVGDYLIAKEDFSYAALPSTASDIDTFLAKFVIVEGNIKNVSNGSVESGKYVSGLSFSNGVFSVSKDSLPVTGVTTTPTAGSGKTTKAIVGISLSGGNVVATEKDIDLKAYPQAVETLTPSTANNTTTASLSHTPSGDVQILLNGVTQTPTTDYTVSGTTVTINAAMGYASGDVLTAVYNYAN